MEVEECKKLRDREIESQWERENDHDYTGEKLAWRWRDHVVIPPSFFSQVVEDSNKELIQSLSIRAFPTFRFYLEGNQVDETRGANIQEVASKVQVPTVWACVCLGCIEFLSTALG